MVLGSGFVAAPMVDWLARQGYPVTVASNVLADAERITRLFDNCEAVTLDASDTAATSALVASSAVTVSLLPHTMHVPIARLCLQHSKHLLTASYVSPAMRALHQQAAASGLVFMNELGLDPGIGQHTLTRPTQSLHPRCLCSARLQRPARSHLSPLAFCCVRCARPHVCHGDD